MINNIEISVRGDNTTVVMQEQSCFSFTKDTNIRYTVNSLFVNKDCLMHSLEINEYSNNPFKHNLKEILNIYNILILTNSAVCGEGKTLTTRFNSAINSSSAFTILMLKLADKINLQKVRTTTAQIIKDKALKIYAFNKSQTNLAVWTYKDDLFIQPINNFLPTKELVELIIDETKK